VSVSRARAFVVLILLVAIAYGASLRNEYVFDDAIFSERDARVQSLEHVDRLFLEPLWGFTDSEGRGSIHQYYRPLQLLPLAASKALVGEAAWPMHLLSLLLHAANALLVYEILRRLSGSSNAAMALAVLFAVHPANSEAVLWASDVAGLGAAFCTLSILLLYVASRPRALVWAAMASLYLAGMWFKESGVLVPSLMAAYDLLLRRRDEAAPAPWRRAASYLVLLPPLSFYLALRVHALGGLLPGAGALTLTPAQLAVNAVALIPSYWSTFLWPFALDMYHDFNAATGWQDPRFLAGAAILLAGAVAALAGLPRRRLLTFGLLWAAITTAPYLLVRWPKLNVFAERYLYLPSVGIYAAVAAVLPAAGKTLQRDRAARLAGAAVAVVVLAFLVTDVRRTGDWHDEITLYTKTLRRSERAELIRNNLAIRLLHEGRAAEGLPLQLELLRLDPDFPSGWHNLGLIYLALDRNEDARAAFEQARAREPLNPATLLNLGYSYDATGRREDAVATYFRLTRVDPSSVKAWYNLAVIALEVGRPGNARRALGEVLAREPDDEAAAKLLARLQRAPAAVSARLDPAAARKSATGLAGRAHAAADAHRWGEAIAELQAALWFAPDMALPHQYLANVYYMTGRIPEAVRQQRAAVALAPGNALLRENLQALESLLADGRRRGDPSHARGKGTREPHRASDDHDDAPSRTDLTTGVQSWFEKR
jgi:tetratricopeptide (TPR) repeat protein